MQHSRNLRLKKLYWACRSIIQLKYKKPAWCGFFLYTPQRLQQTCKIIYSLWSTNTLIFCRHFSKHPVNVIQYFPKCHFQLGGCVSIHNVSSQTRFACSGTNITWLKFVLWHSLLIREATLLFSKWVCFAYKTSFFSRFLGSFLTVNKTELVSYSEMALP